MGLKKHIPFFLCLIIAQISFSQDATLTGTRLIDSLFSISSFAKADSAIRQHIAELKSNKQIDSLIDYTYYVGKIKLELSNTEQATMAVTIFAEEIKSKTEAPHSLRQLYLELATFYELIGNPQKAYEHNIEALNYTSKMEEATGADFGLVHSNLGTYAKRSGNLSLALFHHRKALKYYESYPGSSKESIYITFNSLGGMMWFSSKIDSALYYYHEAENILKELEQTPINKYYRPAMLNNNIAAIYGSQGNVDKAMEAMKSTINNWEAFFSSDANDYKKESGKTSYYQAIENYAGIYKDLGNYQKARDLLAYSYQEKKKYFGADNPELFKAKILMGQIYLALKDYKVADDFLNAGIAHIERIPGAFYFWEADAHYYKATISEALGKTEMAAAHYEKAQILYDKALQGAYDEIYLEFIIKSSYFYAKNGDREKALNMANKTYDYIKENQGEKTLFEFQQVLNLGEIYFVLGDYELALEKSNLSLSLLKNRMFSGKTALDSTFIIFEKPQAILLKVKSEYQLNKKRDTIFLKETLKEIQDALSILEQRKPFLGDDNNLSILIADNNSIFEFAKTLALELYTRTNTEKYLNIVFTIHESSLYNRIRAGLNTKSSISYKNLPAKILAKEKSLKEELNSALNKQESLDLFFEANTKWKNFLNTLKIDYPNYYRLQYASIAESFDNIWPESHTYGTENTTIVRYLFVSDTLYALVIGQHGKDLFQLEQSDLVAQIEIVNDGSLAFEKNSGVLYGLYSSLWKPIESSINTEHVIIIPDRELFNLSFEVLTHEQIESHHDLADNSLLSRHVISYNYSLLLIDKEKGITDFNDNFVAFVPEFNDKMKEDYKISISDSLSIDKTYLSLLPQPFCIDIAKSSAKLFDGTSFLNENSTKPVFKNNAKEHKIIHIGTHAESNNLCPELSRLIFAKPTGESNIEHDNSLFIYEIYDYNLTSNLTILTACETGKPTYQPGEGMISLAHAFNYAGSESILTSLWKIDEQSSAKIVELFYHQLAKGLSKDKALQLAKLEYLNSEDGRTLSPQYWAGLILIGDTSPISISTSSNWMIWLFGVLILLGFGFYIIRKKYL